LGRDDVLEKVEDYVKDHALNRALFIHGPTGSGKTCLLSKVATVAGAKIASLKSSPSSLAASWCQGLYRRKPCICIRFLGSSPKCDSAATTLHSLCQQIAYNLEINMEDIPEEFVPLKNVFVRLLGKASKKKMPVVILIGEGDFSTKV